MAAFFVWAPLAGAGEWLWQPIGAGLTVGALFLYAALAGRSPQ